MTKNQINERPSIDPVVLFKMSLAFAPCAKLLKKLKRIWCIIFAKCTSLSQCTESKNHQKLIQRHILESFVEQAEHLRHSISIKKIYAKRKETIERVIADAMDNLKRS